MSFLLNCGPAFCDVSFHDLLPFSLGLEDEFDGIAEGTVTSGVGSSVVGFLLDFGAGVPYCDGESGGAHGGEVDYIVADEGGFVFGHSGFLDDFFKRGGFVLNALADELQFQVAGAKGYSFRNSLRDQTGFDASEASQGDRGAVVGVEAFGFDQGLALETESSLAALVDGLLEDGLLRSRRSGENEEFAVGKDSVYVEEKEFDFAGAGLSGEFGHRGNFSSLEEGATLHPICMLATRQPGATSLADGNL